MKLRLIGLDHRTAPIELRERFAFDREQTAAFLREWPERFSAFEAVLVSTCNRTELYVGSQNGSLPPTVELLGCLAQSASVADENADAVSKAFFVADDVEALEHLFSVAASLESMVVGEPQILAQIKEAYRAAAEFGTAGMVTHSAFQSALSVAKRVSTETGLFRHRVSIPSIAVVDFALEIFETLADKKTLILGAGEMAEETLRYLTDYGAVDVIVANRSAERAENLARSFGGSVAPWSERYERLAEADLAVVAVSGAEQAVTLESFDQASKGRRSRPLFLLDLSVPRQCAPELAKRPDVYLYSIDDLVEAARRGRKSRDAELPKAKKIVHEATGEFLNEMRLRDSGELIRRLREGWNDVKEAEITRLFHRLPELPDKDRDEIHYAFDRLVNKMLHGPMQSLRDESQEKPQYLLDAMRKLFHLK